MLKDRSMSSKRVASLPLMTRESVALHNTEEDLYVIIDDLVIDVTRFQKHHPGGKKPLQALGGVDSTDPFNNYHPAWVWDRLPAMAVGRIQVAASNFEGSWRDLRQQLLARGLFETDYSYYALKAVWLVSLLASSLYLTFEADPHARCTSSTVGAALLMGAFWQQLAFVGHDAGHNAITHHKATDNVLGILVGNLFGGVSIAWWKRTHNVHHIVTNSVDRDPDIQHLPVLAVTPKQFSPYFSTYHLKRFTMDAVASVLIGYQHYLYYPAMALARFNLYLQSLILVLDPREQVDYRPLELLCLAGFYSWFFFGVAAQYATFNESLLYVIISHAIAGVTLHVQITLSHFSMGTYMGSPHTNEGNTFFRNQLATSMNVKCPEWMDWFHGGLQFQIEHHLFPRLPRHNLRRARELVKPFCARNGIHYHELGFVDANREIIGTLRRTAKEWDSSRGSDPVGTLKETVLWDGLHAVG